MFYTQTYINSVFGGAAAVNAKCVLSRRTLSLLKTGVNCRPVTPLLELDLIEYLLSDTSLECITEAMSETIFDRYLDIIQDPQNGGGPIDGKCIEDPGCDDCQPAEPPVTPPTSSDCAILTETLEDVNLETLDGPAIPEDCN